MPRGDQLGRQWRLLQFLGRPERLAVEDASRQLGCAVRTVWRDLTVLQAAGFPIYDERDGRRGLWKVEPGFRDRVPIPPLASGGKLEMRLTVADTLEVRRWLMGFGAWVQVLAPPALREAIRHEAAALALALAPARKPPARAAAKSARATPGPGSPQALGRAR